MTILMYFYSFLSLCCFIRLAHHSSDWQHAEKKGRRKTEKKNIKKAKMKP